MAEKPQPGLISYFFQNIDQIYSLMVQAEPVLYLLAKNIGIVHKICALTISFVTKIYSFTNMDEKSHILVNFIFSTFGQNLFRNATSCHSFVFASQIYWCS